LLNATDSQDNIWCSVGPAGRHKHWQPAKGNAAASMNHNHVLPLASLPGPAFASVFHHLDNYSFRQLALTCRVCAREAAHHRARYNTNYCAKILPKVQGIAGQHYGRSPYGRLECAWTGRSSDALPYIHHMSKQPDFLASVWKAAWSAIPHSFFADICSMWDKSGQHYECRDLIISICLFIHSTTPLHVSLAWLRALWKTAEATIKQKFVDEGAGYDCEIFIEFSVYRPQGELQENEYLYHGVESPQAGSWKFVCESYREGNYVSCFEPVASKPEDSIAVTGSWCEFGEEGFGKEGFTGIPSDPKPDFNRYYIKKLQQPKSCGRRGWRLSERKQSRNAKRQSLQMPAE